MKLFRMSKSIRSWHFPVLGIEMFWMVGIILIKLENQPNVSFFFFAMNCLIGALMTRTFLQGKYI